MPKVAPSPSTLNLVAQIGVLGEAVSGISAIIWLVRLMLSLRMADDQHSPVAGLWSILWRIATGRLRLRGFDAREWWVHRGTLHLRVVHVSMRGAPGEADVFSVIVEFEEGIEEGFTAGRSEPCGILIRAGYCSQNFTKLGLGLA